jgi:predicted kinase
VARLVLLNGPPGVGKSTLAQLYVDDHPLALNLDIDRIRRLLGRWLDHQEQSGQLARGMALQMAGTHLAADHDVVIPQYVARPDFLARIEHVARDAQAAFVEVVLLDSPSATLRRFVTRGQGPASEAHDDASAIVDRSGGLPSLAVLYDRLLEVPASRPGAAVITAAEGRIPETYAKLLDHLERVSRG